MDKETRILQRDIPTSRLRDFACNSNFRSCGQHAQLTVLIKRNLAPDCVRTDIRICGEEQHGHVVATRAALEIRIPFHPKANITALDIISLEGWNFFNSFRNLIEGYDAYAVN